MNNYLTGKMRIAAIVLSSLCFSVSVNAEVPSKPSAEAKTKADRGKELYKQGQYREAIAEFRESYRLEPAAAQTYNIARCHERLSEWKEAIAQYEKYVVEAQDPKDKSEALDKIELLKKKVGSNGQDPDIAYQLKIESGRQAFRKGDYSTALEDFKAAYNLKPSSGPLYNMAKSYERLGRYLEAVDHFKKYLSLDPHATDRKDVEENIRRLERSLKEHFQELSINSDPKGADIYLDDRNAGVQGQTNFRMKVSPGSHTLFVDLNGYEPIKKDFMMPDDKPLVLDVALKKLQNIGLLEVTLNVDGARIFVDGAIVGLSPYREKKALSEGTHQVQIEAIGYPRHTESVVITKDQTKKLNINLEAYDAPVRDETLSSWGSNLMLIGIIGGTLGIVGPFLYEKLVVKRDSFRQLGPAELSSSNYYRGPLDTSDDNYRRDATYGTLHDIQFWSIVGGSIVTGAGLGFYIYKWVRGAPDNPPVTATLLPSNGGSTFHIQGSF